MTRIELHVLEKGVAQTLDSTCLRLSLAEEVLDGWKGESMLQGVRLGKVMEVRARLLRSKQADLVRSFAQSDRLAREGDKSGLGLYSLNCVDRVGEA